MDRNTPSERRITNAERRLDEAERDFRARPNTDTRTELHAAACEYEIAFDRYSRRHGNAVTPEQQDALNRYAEAAGEDWIDSLLTDWMRAGSEICRDHGIEYALLHQLRNSHGPTWLATEATVEEVA